MRNSLYNPGFLYKILMVLLKCLLNKNDNIISSAGNPKYIAIILGLIRTAPPTHKILLFKILKILMSSLPKCIFKSAISIFKRQVNEFKDETIFKILTSGEDD